MATSPSAVNQSGVDPFQLVNDLRTLVAISSKCGDRLMVDWSRHPQALTVEELEEIHRIIDAHFVCLQFKARQAETR